MVFALKNGQSSELPIELRLAKLEDQGPSGKFEAGTPFSRATIKPPW
jgi:hypothetical protein